MNFLVRKMCSEIMLSIKITTILQRPKVEEKAKEIMSLIYGI